MRQELIQRGLRPTRVFDRTYFHSVYVRMPDGLLLEFATDGPGFAVDEPAEQLGRDAEAPGLARGRAGSARVAAPADLSRPRPAATMAAPSRWWRNW